MRTPCKISAKSINFYYGLIPNIPTSNLCKKFFVFSKEIADSGSIWLATLLQKDCKYIWQIPLKTFQILSVRIFGIADRWSDCDMQGPRLESSLSWNFKVGRLNKNVLLNFITQWYLKNKCYLKLINFLVIYASW